MAGQKPKGRIQLLSVTTAAERLACSPGHVYNLISSGALRSVQITATGPRPKTRVLESELDAFIESRTTHVDPGADQAAARPA